MHVDWVKKNHSIYICLFKFIRNSSIRTAGKNPVVVFYVSVCFIVLIPAARSPRAFFFTTIVKKFPNGVAGATPPFRSATVSISFPIFDHSYHRRRYLKTRRLLSYSKKYICVFKRPLIAYK